MSYAAWLAMVLTTSAAFSQQVEPSQRSVDTFQVEAVSRLAAPAKLGALTNTTLLVEAGDLLALQAPVVITTEHTTVALVIREILRGLDSYKIRNEGALLILSTPGRPNRTLTLPFGTLYVYGRLYFVDSSPSRICHPSRHGLKSSRLRMGWISYVSGDSILSPYSSNAGTDRREGG